MHMTTEIFQNHEMPTEGEAIPRIPSPRLRERTEKNGRKLRAYLEGELYSNCAPELRLRDRQLENLWKILDFFETGSGRGYCELPTGFGKTVVFAHLAKALDARILIFVPTTKLLEQTEERIGEHADSVVTSLVYGKQKDATGSAVITTYASMPSQLGESATGVLHDHIEEFDCVFFDEGHHLLARRARAAYEEHLQDIPAIGFTATAGYSRDKHLEKVLGEPIDTLSVREAIEGGYLPHTRTRKETFGVVKPMDVPLGETTKPDLGGQIDFIDTELAKVFDIRQRNDAIARMYMEKHNNECAGVICATNAHANHMAEAFNRAAAERDIPPIAAAFHGGLSSDEMRQVIEDFDSGKIRVLTGVRLLGEGFDKKQISTMILSVITLSPLKIAQEGGRATRIDPVNPNKIATIVNCVDRGFPEGVLYSHILGGEEVLPLTSSESTGGGGGGGGGDDEEIDKPDARFVSRAGGVLEVAPASPLFEDLVENPNRTGARVCSKGFIEDCERLFRQFHPDTATRTGSGASERAGKEFLDFLIVTAKEQLPPYDWISEGELIAKMMKPKHKPFFQNLLIETEKKLSKEKKKAFGIYTARNGTRKFYSPKFLQTLEVALMEHEIKNDRGGDGMRGWGR